ncbi:hypothetical protein BAE44_0012028 [Dichanthelium oligosanthes]|uniref:Uncharacterized protein n=1 Tax=Dichanthelium oligosanthes TaxID=888268 RepID=A0A1E5VP87_9POAL|nr:hypothetical protein BAE44_0012028 [Dichanthelium oligosanthes]
MKSNRPPEDFVETAGERSIWKACETFAADMIETIRSSFLAFEGSGINSSCQLDAGKLDIDLDGEIPTDVIMVYGNGKTGSQLSTRGTYDQLLERQEVKKLPTGNTSQNVTNSGRYLEIFFWKSHPTMKSIFVLFDKLNGIYNAYI